MRGVCVTNAWALQRAQLGAMLCCTDQGVCRHSCPREPPVLLSTFTTKRHPSRGRAKDICRFRHICTHSTRPAPVSRGIYLFSALLRPSPALLYPDGELRTKEVASSEIPQKDSATALICSIRGLFSFGSNAWGLEWGCEEGAVSRASQAPACFLSPRDSSMGGVSSLSICPPGQRQRVSRHN